MIGLGNIEVPAFIRKWEKELERKLTEPEVWLILRRASATSVNCKILELNFKCLARMYLTPDCTHKYQNDTSQYCWRGCKELGSMAHIWWFCPEIMIFWREVKGFIKDITSIDIPDDPWVCLFHMSELPTKTYLKTLLPHLINVAKSLIPRYWQKKERPTMRDWFNKINDIYRLEYLRFSEGMKMAAFEMKWKAWVEFTDSLRAAEIWAI